MKNMNSFLFVLSLIVFCSGCSGTKLKPVPISYLSVEAPTGVITTSKSVDLDKKFPRGGWYFGNLNFRPAPNIRSYVEQISNDENVKILKNVDVKLSVPIYFDILIFGYNKGTDLVSVSSN